VRPEPLFHARPEAAVSYGPDGPAIDEAALVALAEIIGVKALDSVVTVMLDSTPALCASMARAHAAGDAAALRTAAHQLKGSAANLGARRLPTVCAELEQVAGAGDLVAAAPLVAEAQREYGRVHAALAAATLGAFAAR